MLIEVDWCSRVGAIRSWRDKNPKIEVRESKKEFLKKQLVEKLVEMFLTTNKNNLLYKETECILKLTDKSYFKSKYNKTFSVKETNFIKENISKMLTLKQIRSSDSPHESPIILVTKKPRGDFSMCIDYRQLNEALVHNVFQMPKTEQIFLQMNSHTFYSKINLANA
jgi:hypothetical protein